MISRGVLGLACCAVVLAAGCGSGAASSSTADGGGGGADGESSASSPAHVQSCAGATFARMDPAERIGQLFLVGLPVPGGPGAELTGAIQTYHFGSALIVGDSSAGVQGVRQMTDAVQRLATVGAKLFVAANQEGGQIQPLTGPGFATIPPATVQGTMPAGQLQDQATQWGRELAAAGVNLNLAPVLDVVPAGTESTNAPIGALQREYGSTPGTAAEHGVAFFRGMQAAGIAASAKHFPGLGRVRGNTDFTANVTDTVTGKHDPYLRPYQAAIDAGVPFMMVALARYTRIDDAHLAAFSARIVTGMLRQRLGFRGVIVSDDLGAQAVASVTPADRAVAFLDAGGDMITEQSASAAGQMATALLHRSAAEMTLRRRIANAVMKILAAKAAYGLLSC